MPQMQGQFPPQLYCSHLSVGRELRTPAKVATLPAQQEGAAHAPRAVSQRHFRAIVIEKWLFFFTKVQCYP